MACYSPDLWDPVTSVIKSKMQQPPPTLFHHQVVLREGRTFQIEYLHKEVTNKLSEIFSNLFLLLLFCSCAW